MKRARDLIGRWGYCKKCGQKAFDAGTDWKPELLCGAACGYISRFDIEWSKKNVRRYEE